VQGLGVLIEDSEADRQFVSLSKTTPGALTLAEFADFMLEQLKAGSSMEDIIAAFRTLAGGEVITEVQINTYFVQDDHAAYMLRHMPPKNEAYDYDAFTVAIFER
jgi:hypothetical protein